MRPEEKTGVMTRGRDQFPVGMRVLAVDDDPVCLKVLETLLLRCQYHGPSEKDTISTGFQKNEVLEIITYQLMHL